MLACFATPPTATLRLAIHTGKMPCYNADNHISKSLNLAPVLVESFNARTVFPTETVLSKNNYRNRIFLRL